MRSLENIVTDPANGNSPEFIAEKLGLAPVLVRCADDMAVHNMELAKLPELGSYVPEGWVASTASAMIPVEMTQEYHPWYGMGNDAIAMAMITCFQDRQGMPQRGKEYGLAIDQRGACGMGGDGLSSWLSIRGYERTRAEFECEFVPDEYFEDDEGHGEDLAIDYDDLCPGADFESLPGDPGSDERIEGLREFYDGQDLRPFFRLEIMTGGGWSAEYGSYDREDVEAEQACYDSRPETRIVKGLRGYGELDGQELG